MNTKADSRPTLPWLPIATSLIFAYALTQPAVFYSNQNQYFLHGLASTGLGDLTSDWLANTKDPTPVFSWCVAKLYPIAGSTGVYAVFYGMAVLYYLSLWGIVSASRWKPLSLAGQLAFAGLVTGVHSGVARWASVRWLEMDYPWFFQCGVANQYILGAGLQPSVFGIFLLSAIALFGHGRIAGAGIAIVLSCSLHSTYLLPGAMLVVGMMAWLWRSMGLKRAMMFGVSILTGVLPVTLLAIYTFRPTDTETFAEGQRIIAWIRIPHHCDYQRWLDWIAWSQIAGVGAAVLLLRRSSLCLPVGIAFGLAVVLSLIQIVTNHTSLALIFPWRLSAVLVPVATAVLSAVVASGLARLPQWSVSVVSILVLIAGLIGAERIQRMSLAYQVSTAEEKLQQFVEANRKPGELYLVPVSFPKPPTKPGSPSASFVPVSQTGRPAVFEMQRFRLITGACAYVDFKSIPYADVDVIEWHNRVNTAIRWYSTPDWDASGILNEVRRAGITHIVVPEGVQVTSSRFVEVFGDRAYRVLRID